METAPESELRGFGWSRARTPAELLRWTDTLWGVSEGLGRTALHWYRDVDTYKRLLRYQASLLIELPGRMAVLEDAPKSVTGAVNDLSYMARSGLADMDAHGSGFGIASLLYGPDSQYGDPSLLACLADSIDEPVVLDKP